MREKAKRAQSRSIKSSRCFFCGTGGTMTWEHVFGDWLNKLGYGGEGFREYISERPAERTVQTGGPFSKRLKIVCGKCNNDWMAKMEEAAKPILLELFNTPGQVVLDQDAQLALARWAFKSAAILSQAVGAGGDFPLDHRRSFHGEDRIPDAVQVRIGTASIVEQPLGTQLGESHYLPRRMTVRIEGAPTVTVPMYFARFRLLNVAFEVVGHTVPPTLQVAVDTESALGNALLPLCPAKFEKIWWPPAQSLDAIGGVDGLAKVQIVGVPTIAPDQRPQP